MPAARLSTQTRVDFVQDRNTRAKLGFVERVQWRRVYRPQDAMTPLDKLTSLPEAESFLRDGVTLATLQTLARKHTDVQAAQKLQLARSALFKQPRKRTA